MTRRMLNLAVQTIALISLISIDGVAQSQDRAQIEKEIEVLREQLRQKEEQLGQKELEFLAPSPEDRAQFAEFLLQPDTGLARLLPREKYREKLNIREGGAYFSFTRLSHS